MFENTCLRVISRFYGLIIKVGDNLQSLFLLYMRLIWGHQFFIAGLTKFQHVEVVTQFFASLHIQAPMAATYIVASFEILGGICLFFGFASRLLSIPLIVIMTSALLLAHQSDLSTWNIFMQPDLLVHEAPYPFLVTALLVLIFGPGKIALDGWLKRWVSRQPKY